MAILRWPKYGCHNSSAHPLKNGVRCRVSFGLVLAVLVVFQTGAVSQDHLASTGSTQSQKPLATGSTSQATSPSTELRCPPGTTKALKLAPQTSRHHKVTLSWTASVPATNPEYNAVGYCLYRSRIADVAKQSPACPDCEQISVQPIVGTSCLDDSAEDNIDYFYVAIAIDAKGRTSVTSNLAPASIPSADQISTASKVVPAQPPPQCRGDSGSQ